jgi:hypothetical protein
VLKLSQHINNDGQGVFRIVGEFWANLLPFLFVNVFLQFSLNVILFCVLQKEEIARQFNFLPERKSKIATLLKQEDAQEYCICRSSDSNRFMMYVKIDSNFLRNSSLIYCPLPEHVITVKSGITETASISLRKTPST